MKRWVLTLFVALSGISALAQSNDGTERKEIRSDKKQDGQVKCSSFYIGTSTGINNNSGVLGFNLDLPVMPNVSVVAGAGISSWGGKIYGGVNYFFHPCHIGWALGVAVTHNSGLENFNTDLETINGRTETVVLDLHPQTNVAILAYRYWKMGKGYNRFYINFGLSKSLNSDKFSQTDGLEISDKSVNTVNTISPGGLVAAVGFCFGIK